MTRSPARSYKEMPPPLEPIATIHADVGLAGEAATRAGPIRGIADQLSRREIPDVDPSEGLAPDEQCTVHGDGRRLDLRRRIFEVYGAKRAPGGDVPEQHGRARLVDDERAVGSERSAGDRPPAAARWAPVLSVSQSQSCDAPCFVETRTRVVPGWIRASTKESPAGTSTARRTTASCCCVSNRYSDSLPRASRTARLRSRRHPGSVGCSRSGRPRRARSCRRRGSTHRVPVASSPTLATMRPSALTSTSNCRRRGRRGTRGTTSSCAGSPRPTTARLPAAAVPT